MINKIIKIKSEIPAIKGNSNFSFLESFVSFFFERIRLTDALLILGNIF